MPEEVCLIINPEAGRGVDKKLKKLFATALRKIGGHLVFTESEGENTATRLARWAQKHFKRIGVASGDGTAQQVVEGLSLPDPSTSLGIVPIGRANNLADALCVPRSVEGALDLLLNGENIVPVDLGIVNNRPFVSTFSIGFDAKVNQAVFAICSRLKRVPFWQNMFFLWKLPFILAFFGQMGRCVPYSQLALQGDIVRQVPTVLLTVNNVPKYASMFRMTPQARIDDGLLDVCLIIAPMTRREMISISFEAINGRHTRFPQVSIHQIRHLIIESEEVLVAQIDGEPIEPATRFEISVFPKALNVIVPPSLS